MVGGDRLGAGDDRDPPRTAAPSRRAGPDPRQRRASRPLWTAIPLVTVLVLFGLTIQTLGKVDAQGTGGVNLHVTAFRWQWQARLSRRGRAPRRHRRPARRGRPAGRPARPRHAGLGRREPLVLRPGVPVQARRDPGRRRPRSTSRSARPGVYPGACAEFCGVGHAQMPFTIRGVDQADLRRLARGSSGSRAARERRAVSAVEGRVGRRRPRSAPAGRFDLLEWLTTTDHKRIGILYITSAFGFAIVGGLLAEIIRLELAAPGRQLVDASTYDQLFTMHGTLMLLFFAGPLAIGFANSIVPLQIGAADMAFPRLNALSFWLFLFGGLIVMAGFLTSRRRGGGRLDGLRAAVERAVLAPGGDGPVDRRAWRWSASRGSSARSTSWSPSTAAGRPGMHMFRMPMFTWTMLVTSRPDPVRVPVDHRGARDAAVRPAPRRRRSSTRRRAAPRSCGSTCSGSSATPRSTSSCCRTSGSSARSSRCSRASRCSGTATWCSRWSRSPRCRWACGRTTCSRPALVSLPFFSLLSLLIAVPTGIKIFNWVGTMWGGRLRFPVPMLWCIGVIYVFTIGGITGVMLASPPIDYGAQDTYFVVAHMHNVLIGGSVFAGFAGIYFWFPKLTGRMLSEAPGPGPRAAVGRRLRADVRAAVHARRRGHAAADRRLPGQPGLGGAQPGLDDRRAPARRGHGAVPRRRRPRPPATGRRAGRSVGRQLARVGDVVAAAAPQLRLAAADPLRATGVRRPGRGARRGTPPADDPDRGRRS